MQSNPRVEKVDCVARETNAAELTYAPPVLTGFETPQLHVRKSTRVKVKLNNFLEKLYIGSKCVIILFLYFVCRNFPWIDALGQKIKQILKGRTR